LAGFFPFKLCKPGMVVHACNPSSSGGWGTVVRVPDQPRGTQQAPVSRRNFLTLY
jgi:hypothetical protein